MTETPLEYSKKPFGSSPKTVFHMSKFLQNKKQDILCSQRGKNIMEALASFPGIIYS